MSDDAEARDANGSSGSSGGGGSKLTVVLALGANIGVGVLKLVAGLLSGSSAMLAEAAHSVADVTTEGLLLTALKRSSKQPDLRHPFGYGQERFFWALIAAVSVFVTGATFSVYEGVTTILGEGAEETLAWVAYAVLGLSAIIEGISWQQAVRQVWREKAELGIGLRRYLRLTDDPTVVNVFYEDTAALIGLVLAAAGVFLHQATGSGLWDGLASLAIGLLLAAVAFFLGRTNKHLLIGRNAEPRVMRAVFDHITDAPEVAEVVDLQTMLLGTDSVLVCARVDFDDSLGAGDVEQACVRIDAEMRERFTDLQQVFLEPVPHDNVELRQAVLDRYGDMLTEWREEHEREGSSRAAAQIAANADG